MKKGKLSRAEQLRRELEDLKKFMQDRGNSEQGYIRYYGSIDEPNHYGDGGEAIWAADKAALDELEALVAPKMRRQRGYRDARP